MKHDNMNDPALKRAYGVYLNSKWSTLYEAYKNPSVAKRAAWERVLERVKELAGYDVRICHAGCQVFSVGFKYVDAMEYTHWVYIDRYNEHDVIIYYK